MIKRGDLKCLFKEEINSSPPFLKYGNLPLLQKLILYKILIWQFYKETLQIAIRRVWSYRLSNLTLRGKHFVVSVLNLEYEVTEHWSISQNFIRWDSVQKVCKFYGPSSHELPIRVWENTGGVFRITWSGGQPMRRQQGRAQCGASSGHSSVSRAADYHGVRPDTGNNTVTTITTTAQSDDQSPRMWQWRLPRNSPRCLCRASSENKNR